MRPCYRIVGPTVLRCVAAIVLFVAVGAQQLAAQARTIRFETTEGTWMNVDVSPDGKTLVFDLLGDLYTLPIAGGTATRLTSGSAFDTDPVFSSDGKQIAFVSD